MANRPEGERIVEISYISQVDLMSSKMQTLTRTDNRSVFIVKHVRISTYCSKDQDN
jgi:hypothetical protein